MKSVYETGDQHFASLIEILATISTLLMKVGVITGYETGDQHYASLIQMLVTISTSLMKVDLL